jgi:SpoIIAA-like
VKQAASLENAPFRIGMHWAQQQGPILFFRPEGIMRLSDNQALFEHMERIKLEQGRVYILLDASHNTKQDPAGRAWGARNVNEANRPSAVAIFGASFHARVLATLFAMAANTIVKYPVSLEFFSTEAEARDFLARKDMAFGSEH